MYLFGTMADGYSRDIVKLMNEDSFIISVVISLYVSMFFLDETVLFSVCYKNNFISSGSEKFTLFL